MVRGHAQHVPVVFRESIILRAPCGTIDGAACLHNVRLDGNRIDACHYWLRGLEQWDNVVGQNAQCCEDSGQENGNDAEKSGNDAAAR